MGDTKKFRVIDHNTGEEVEVILTEVKPHGTEARASMMEAMQDDLYETWHLNEPEDHSGLGVEVIQVI